MAWLGLPAPEPYQLTPHFALSIRGAICDLGKWAMTSLKKCRSCRIAECPAKCIDVQEAMERAAKVNGIDKRNMNRTAN